MTPAARRYHRLMPGPREGPPVPPVRVGMLSRYGHARMQVLLSQAVIDDLGATYHVDIGADSETLHLLRLTASPDGRHEARPLHRPDGSPSHTWRLLLPEIERLPSGSVPPREVDTRTSSRTLTITLPAWAWDPASRREAEQMAARIASRRHLARLPASPAPPLAPLPERTHNEAGRAGALAVRMARRKETT